jgi:hypothetical protein
VNSNQDKRFDIVRENEQLVVINGKGFIFTGNFRHAGVPNIAPGTSESTLLENFKTKMAEIDDSRRGVASKDSHKLKLLGNFKGLRELCRLHCATQVKEGCGKVIIPSNSVGFFECLQNPPDSASPPKKQSSYKRSHDDVVSDSDAEIETVKVLKSTQMPRNAHPIQCPVCGEEILVASDITLPYWRSLKSKRSKSSQEQVQEGTSK